MEKPDVRESIEELIEETYLLGLSERDIKADLDRFVESCGRVIRDNVRDRKQMQELADKLARARALSLIGDRTQEESDLLLDSEGGVKSSRARFAKRVARNKRLILRTIGECDPRLVEQIEQARFPAQGEEQLPALPISRKPTAKAKNLVLKGCYALTLIFVLLLVYLVLLQQNF